ncbi:Lipase/vitellogenin [Trinorchestia longiramus]|nr:Lipase/vitellogenin [Trinorchestia longiramus]
MLEAPCALPSHRNGLDMANLTAILHLAFYLYLLTLTNLPSTTSWPSDPRSNKNYLGEPNFSPNENFSHFGDVAAQHGITTSRTSTEIYASRNSQRSGVNKDIPSLLQTSQIEHDEFRQTQHPSNPNTVVVVEFPQSSSEYSSFTVNSGLLNQTSEQRFYSNILPSESHGHRENSGSISEVRKRSQPTPRKINIDRPQSQLLQAQPPNNIEVVNFTPIYQVGPYINYDTSHLQINKGEDSPYPGELRPKKETPTPVKNEDVGHILSAEHMLELLRRSEHRNSSRPETSTSSNTKEQVKKQDSGPKLKSESRPRLPSFFEILLESLRNLPVVGNVLRAQVDPVYRPILNSILPSAQSRQSTDEFHEERHCFGKIGCFETTIDFYDPIIRPINLPPDTREAINTHYTLYTRTQPEGVPLTRRTLRRIIDTSYDPFKPTKFIIHGFLDDQNSTWIKEMVRGLLFHGDYNVFSVDWSGGSRVIYHQAVTNIRVVALEVSALINSLKFKLGQDPAKVHVIGHSLGSHTAGYIGERVPGLGRITGLDPAEPFFQYMPPSVRLDPSDASFVDVIHTDTDSIITLAWQFAGYGLEQPIGHVDFYPNGGRGQPGCSSLSRIALTALRDGSGIIEGLDAAEKEAVACNHIRSSKLFTASLFGTCSFMAFPCKSYDEFEKARCFSCDTDLGCAPLGIHADTWHPHGRENVNMYLSTSGGPDFCQYHYRLTVTLADERRQGGSLRGRLKITFITPSGELRDFDLTEDSPLLFKRGNSHTFLLRHGEDLSGSRDALVNWRFEADVFNPLTFCVLFCIPELELSTITLTPLDTPSVADNTVSLKDATSPDIVMCHKQGQSVIKLDSAKTIKISAEPFCPDLEKKHRRSAAEKRRASVFLFPGDLPIIER